MNLYEVKAHMRGVGATVHRVRANNPDTAFHEVRRIYNDHEGHVNPTMAFDYAKLVTKER